ncbi:MAG TPA: hypothetical protein VK553_07120 [Candidatus Nitrosopolaris rasttigaisensis]|nr:hypothetical protein [Candidatus Nitrosopolaris rasttigaisensis]
MKTYLDERTRQEWVNVEDLPSEKECREMLEWNLEVLHKVADLIEAGKLDDADGKILNFLEENSAILKQLID